MPDINPRINMLRLRVQLAESLYASSETHAVLATSLGTVWDMAVETWASPTLAAEFFLNKNGMLEGKRPMDIALSGEDGHKMVYDHIGRIQHGIHC
jgi:uncharacterized protein (DUF2384 family)